MSTAALAPVVAEMRPMTGQAARDQWSQPPPAPRLGQLHVRVGYRKKTASKGAL